MEEVVMSRARRRERREQRQARRQVRRADRQERRADRREDRAERREVRAQNIRDRGGNIRRANRIDRRAGRSHARADRAQARSDASRGQAQDTIGGTAATLRLEARLLSNVEWARYINAVRTLKETPNYWEDLVAQHTGAMSFAHNIDNSYQFGFLTWHRQYLLDFEEDLREVDEGVRLPYWDWRSRRRVPKHMGVEDWMSLELGRGKRASAFGRKIKLNRIEKIDNFEEMSDTIELLHNSIHGSLGGDMQTMMSPNDPIFFMHHAFVDKMWDYWQAQNANIANNHPFPSLELPGYPGIINADVMENDDLGVDYF